MRFEYLRKFKLKCNRILSSVIWTYRTTLWFILQITIIKNAERFHFPPPQFDGQLISKHNPKKTLLLIHIWVFSSFWGQVRLKIGLFRPLLYLLWHGIRLNSRKEINPFVYINLYNRKCIHWWHDTSGSHFTAQQTGQANPILQKRREARKWRRKKRFSPLTNDGTFVRSTYISSSSNIHTLRQKNQATNVTRITLSYQHSHTGAQTHKTHNSQSKMTS